MEKYVIKSEIVEKLKELVYRMESAPESMQDTWEAVGLYGNNGHVYRVVFSVPKPIGMAPVKDSMAAEIGRLRSQVAMLHNAAAKYLRAITMIPNNELTEVLRQTVASAVTCGLTASEPIPPRLPEPAGTGGNLDRAPAATPAEPGTAAPAAEA